MHDELSEILDAKLDAYENGDPAAYADADELESDFLDLAVELDDFDFERWE